VTKKERKDLDGALELAAHWANLFAEAERKQRAERVLSDALAGALREAIRLLTPKAPDGSPASGVVAESVALLISHHAAREAICVPDSTHGNAQWAARSLCPCSDCAKAREG